MIKRFLCLTLLTGLFGGLFAQSDYWQQDVQYEIRVKLDDQKHMLYGQEKLYYTNNSPDQLQELYIHLWPNAYKDNTTAFAQQKLENGSTKFHFAEEGNRGFIDSLDFQVDGKTVKWEFFEDNWDIAHVTLNQPLKSGESLVFTTPFRVKIPASYSRLGHIKQQYQITQWYPKPAVYDREGWHPMPYLDQGEFYSEFGSYDVWIDVPANYVVGATGDMEENDLETQFLNQREDLSVQFLELPEEEAVFPMEYAEEEYKSLHFTQQNVHDFAWFCDKDYYLIRSLIELPYTNETVECRTLFTNLERKYWGAIGNKALEQSILAYSLFNGNYPYKQVTAVEGALSAGAGMEYPNITVVSANDSEENLEQVIMHEVGHNWFYGILGSNERAHPWMDEGLNSYMENRYWKQYHGDSTTLIPESIQKAIGINLTSSFTQEAAYRFSAGENSDSPIEYPAADYTNICYGTIVYMKTARAFHFLEGYLGKEVNDLCYQTYFSEWKFKHPQPKDLQNVFEKVSKQDLSWFFEDFLSGTDKIDFKITKIDQGRVTVKNKSGILLPCPVSLQDKDGKTTVTKWIPPFADAASIEMGTSEFHRAVVDPEAWVPEFHDGNNYRRNSKFLPALKAPKFNFGYKYPRADRYNVNWLPAPGYNTTDGFMLGGLFYHGFYPKDKFEFHVLPMYGFKSKTLTGSAGFTYRWLPKKAFRKIELHSRTSVFADLLRSKHFLEFYFKKPSPRSPMDQKLTFNLYHFDNRNNIGEYFSPSFATAVYNYGLHKPFYDIDLQAETGFNAPNSTYRGSLTLGYHQRIGKKYDVYLRGFVGGFAADANIPTPLRYGLSGSGDPFGENILIDRAGNVNWLNRQIVTDHGGFRSLQAGRFGSLLTTAGITTEVLGSFLMAYGDIGTGQTVRGDDYDLYYSAGFQVSIPGDILKIYLPLLGSQFVDGVPASGNNFAQNIAFSLTFRDLNDLIPR